MKILRPYLSHLPKIVVERGEKQETSRQEQFLLLSHKYDNHRNCS